MAREAKLRGWLLHLLHTLMHGERRESNAVTSSVLLRHPAVCIGSAAFSMADGTPALPAGFTMARLFYVTLTVRCLPRLLACCFVLYGARTLTDSHMCRARGEGD